MNRDACIFLMAYRKLGFFGYIADERAKTQRPFKKSFPETGKTTQLAT
jgi:hypothetical protein